MTSRKFERSLNNDLYRAHAEARKRKLATTNQFRFELNYSVNLAQIATDILNRDYSPSRGIAFVTERPVIREIFAAPFRDRVVHHYLIGHVEPWWDRHFICDSYSCRKGKGTDYGIRRLYYKMRKVSDNFHVPTYVAKFDLQGYFTSLPRQGLYDRAIWGLDRQFDIAHPTFFERELRDTLAFLWQQIIFDNPIENVTLKGNRELWKQLPARKSLFGQKPGVGIVIGNLTSQVLSNIYLDPLDRFISINLGYKNYGRYVDDFYIVLREDQLKHFYDITVPQIEEFIIGLGLKLHPEKCVCLPIAKGVPFLGAIIYPYHVLPSERLINNYRNDLINIVAGEKDLTSLASYMGRLQHFDAQHLQQHLWDLVGLKYKMARSGPNSRYYTDPKAFDRLHPTYRRPGRLSASGLYYEPDEWY